jgi:hypothetical protein
LTRGCLRDDTDAAAGERQADGDDGGTDELRSLRISDCFAPASTDRCQAKHGEYWPEEDEEQTQDRFKRPDVNRPDWDLYLR